MCSRPAAQSSAGTKCCANCISADLFGQNRKQRMDHVRDKRCIRQSPHAFGAPRQRQAEAAWVAEPLGNELALGLAPSMSWAEGPHDPSHSSSRPCAALNPRGNNCGTQTSVETIQRNCSAQYLLHGNIGSAVSVAVDQALKHNELTYFLSRIHSRTGRTA